MKSFKSSMHFTLASSCCISWWDLLISSSCSNTKLRVWSNIFLKLPASKFNSKRVSSSDMADSIPGRKLTGCPLPLLSMPLLTPPLPPISLVDDMVLSIDSKSNDMSEFKPVKPCCFEIWYTKIYYGISNYRVKDKGPWSEALHIPESSSWLIFKESTKDFNCM